MDLAVAKELNEDYLDCAGNRRFFRLGLHANDRFLEAVEIKQVQPTGLRFLLPVSLDGIPPWGEMREKIRARLSQRDVVRDDDGRLQVLNRTIRAQISTPDG